MNLLYIIFKTFNKFFRSSNIHSKIILDIFRKMFVSTKNTMGLDKPKLVKLQITLLCNPLVIIVLSILYIFLLKGITLAYCMYDILLPYDLGDEYEAQISIVRSVTLNPDGSRTVITKDNGEFIISPKLNKLDYANALNHLQGNERMYNNRKITIIISSHLVEQAHLAPVRSYEHVEPCHTNDDAQFNNLIERIERSRPSKKIAREISERTLGNYSTEDISFMNTITTMRDSPAKAQIIVVHLYNKLETEINWYITHEEPFEYQTIIRDTLLNDITVNLWYPSKVEDLPKTILLCDGLIFSNYLSMSNPTIEHEEKNLRAHMSAVLKILSHANHNGNTPDRTLYDKDTYNKIYNDFFNLTDTGLQP